MEYYFVYMTGLAGKDRGYWNAVNSAKLFSQLNPYFIFMDSLTLFPDTELYPKVIVAQKSGRPKRLDSARTYSRHFAMK